MSATTDPGATPAVVDATRISATGAAPPPPGTVVWSILPWNELLASFGWLESRWAPLDGRELPGDCTLSGLRSGATRLPDARGAVLQGPADRNVLPARSEVATLSPTSPADQAAGSVVPLSVFVIL